MSAGRWCTAFAAGLLSLAALLLPQPGTAQQVELAALAPETPTAQCFDDSQKNAQRRVLTCTAAIESGRLSPRERPRAHLRRAEAHAATGDAARAADDYRETIRLDDARLAANKADPTALLERGLARHALGEAERALADYEETIRLDPGNPLAFANRAIALATRKRDLRGAVADFDRALALAPDTVEMLVLRADAHMQLGDPRRALADLERAVALAPGDARARVLHGLARAKLGDRQKAHADYTAALILDPQNVDALVNRAALSILEGNTAPAILDLDAALFLQPGNAVAHFNRGYARFLRGDYEPALADYTAALSLDPTLGPAHLNRCLTRGAAGKDIGLAVKDCDEAQRLMPGKAEVRETRGFVHLKLGEPQAALAEYDDAALAVDAGRPLALYGRGLARSRRGDVAGGEADKKAARALMPDVARAFAPYGLF